MRPCLGPQLASVGTNQLSEGLVIAIFELLNSAFSHAEPEPASKDSLFPRFVEPFAIEANKLGFSQFVLTDTTTEFGGAAQE